MAGPSRSGVASKAVEFQMRFRDIVSRAGGEGPKAPPEDRRLGPYLSVSREAGSGGAEVARLVGERLGWPVLDRELVEQLAKELEVTPQLLELIDETDSNWFRDTVLNLLETRLVLQDEYVDRIGKVIMLAAYEGHVIIVGRGANLILPREAGLRVRVVATSEERTAYLARQSDIDERTAARRMGELDRSRREFIRRHFRCDPDDPCNYDLAIDRGPFGLEGTAEVVLAAMRVRGLAD